MINFKDYINEKEEIAYDTLNEDPLTISLAILGLPTVIALTAFGGSLILKGYSKFLSAIISKTITLWRNIFTDIKSIGKQDIVNTIKLTKQNSYVKKAVTKEEENRRIYEDKLKKVYSAISKKDFSNAKTEMNKLDKNITNNTEVHRVIISEISSALKEPPLYVTSPGNRSYQAVKKVLNIRVARAAAEASKTAIEKTLKS